MSHVGQRVNPDHLTVDLSAPAQTAPPNDMTTGRRKRGPRADPDPIQRLHLKRHAARDRARRHGGRRA